MLEVTGLAGNPSLGYGIFDMGKLYVLTWDTIPEHWQYDIRYLFLADPGAEKLSPESNTPVNNNINLITGTVDTSLHRIHIYTGMTIITLVLVHLY